MRNIRRFRRFSLRTWWRSNQPVRCFTCRRIVRRKNTRPAIHCNSGRIEAAIEIASRYGQIPGDHHRAWVIDQMCRSLLGNAYDQWVIAMKDDGDEYDEGIAP